SQKVKQTIRSLTHVPDALTPVRDQRFAAQFFHFFIEENPFQMSRSWNFPCSEGTHEYITLPLGKLVTRIKSHAGDGNRGSPVHQRRFKPFARELRGLPWALIGPAETKQRPTVVHSRLENVDLIAAIRAVFVQPHFAGSRMHSQS